MSSILDDVKHMLGLLPAETAFDSDVIIHINTVFGVLHQIGVGPPGGFRIDDNTTQWDEFITDDRLNGVKSYMFLRVKLFFDPPQTGFTQQAMERQITEMEYRLNVAAEYPYFGTGGQTVIIEGGVG
jgi:hypothetical protein